MSFGRSAYVFTPTSISNCTLWLDGADPAGTGVLPANGSLSTWVDKSGNGGNATQSTSGNRPTFTGSGVIFNASSSQFFNLNTSFTSTHSIFIVATPTSASQVYLFGRNYTGGGGSSPSIILNYTGTSLEYYSGNDGTTRSTYASPTSTFIAGYVRTYGSSLLGRYNGSQIFSAGGPTSEPSSIAWGALGQAAVGAGYYTGTIYEFLIFNTTALSIPQCQQVEGYLAQKWGLTSSLPAGHPGLTTKIYNAQYRKPNIMGTLPYYTAFSPIAISNCALWLDASDSSTITKSGSVVTQWNDKSGNGRNTTTIGGSPTYSSNFINLNGSSTYLVGPYVNTTQYLTMFVIATVDFSQGNYAFYYRLLSVGSTAANDYGSSAYTSILHNASSTQIGGYRNFAFNYNTVITNTTFLICLQYDGTNSINYLNGGSASSVASTGSFGTTSYSIGRDVGNTDGGGSYTYWPGKVGEVIIYNSSLSITQRQQVESYLSQKWGLTASLPGDHSHFTKQAGALTKVSNTIARMVGTPRVTISIPTTIAGIQMWMDGADPAGTGVVPSNGSVLSTWVDKSGKSFSATGVNSPTVVTNAVNSKSAVSYNGSSYSYSTVASGTFSTAMNIFFVYKVNGAVSYAAPMTRGQGNNGSPIDQYNVTRYLGGGSYNGYSSAWSHASATSTTLFTQLIQQSPSTTYNEYVNGSTTASLSVTGFSASDAASYVYIGTRDDKVTSFNGYMCELIIYNAMVGLAAQQKIEGYLAWKWGIQASLPGGHPYASAAP
jgi:hypothetical protein